MILLLYYQNFNTKGLIYVGDTERANVNSSRLYIAIDNIESRIHTIFQVYRFNSFSVICNSYIVKIGPFVWEVLTVHMLIVQILYPAITTLKQKYVLYFKYIYLMVLKLYYLKANLNKLICMGLPEGQR